MKIATKAKKNPRKQHQKRSMKKMEDLEFQKIGEILMWKH